MHGMILLYVVVALLVTTRCYEATAKSAIPSVHTVITTECSTYFDWQMLGLAYR
jgi:hypothetical protein